MRDDLISRQAAIDALKKAYWDSNIQSAKNDPCIVDAMADWAIRQVKALPTIEPRARGEWDDIGGVIRWGCPFCHHAYEVKSNFCPNCGADMREEGD